MQLLLHALDVCFCFASIYKRQDVQFPVLDAVHQLWDRKWAPSLWGQPYRIVFPLHIVSFYANIGTEFCHPIIEPTYPGVAVFQKLVRSLAQSSQNKTLYHNCFSLQKKKKDLFLIVSVFDFQPRTLVPSMLTYWAMQSTYVRVIKKNQ